MWPGAGPWAQTNDNRRTNEAINDLRRLSAQARVTEQQTLGEMDTKSREIGEVQDAARQENRAGRNSSSAIVVPRSVLDPSSGERHVNRDN